jgi:HTH-type transcriptional regulator, competence development regulator
MERFGDYIKKLRASKGMNQTQLAAKLDIDTTNLSRIETGKRSLDEDKLEKLAKIFSLDLGQLKDQYFSEQFALTVCKYKCSDNVLALAEQKVAYFRSIKVKQSKIIF